MTDPFQTLAGKVAMVTGAGNLEGIGFATALLLGQAGARVVIADLPSSNLDGVRDALDNEGIEAMVLPLDISDEGAVRAAFAAVKDRFGRLDVLDNNAASQGHAGDGMIGEMTTELWDSIFAVNARGTMLMCKHAIPLMIAGGGGSIINTTSGTAQAGDFFATAYAATKGAINTLTRYVATQYGAQRIRCNAIAPGLVVTGALKASLPPPALDIFRQHTVVGALSEPRDIAAAVLFLASDAARMISGQLLPVDGGFYAHIPTVPQISALMRGAAG